MIYRDFQDLKLSALGLGPCVFRLWMEMIQRSIPQLQKR